MAWSQASADDKIFAIYKNEYDAEQDVPIFEGTAEQCLDFVLDKLSTFEQNFNECIEAVSKDVYGIED